MAGDQSIAQFLEDGFDLRRQLAQHLQLSAETLEERLPLSPARLLTTS